MSATTVDEAEIERLSESLRRHGIEGVRLAIVLGSGLGAFASCLERARSIPYEEVDAMPRAHVPGHAGDLVFGESAGVRVLVQRGRVHLYEGRSAGEVTRAVRAFARIGVRAIVLSNAAGSLHREWKPGTLMRIRDHIDLQGSGPLAPSEASHGIAYDVELGSVLDAAARERDVALRNGVYAGVLGPSYETPAEIRMLAWMGADAVGMSTVAEAAASRASGVRVAAISCITNLASGIGTEKLSHDEVLRTGRETSARFASLLETAIPEINRRAAS